MKKTNRFLSILAGTNFRKIREALKLATDQELEMLSKACFETANSIAGAHAGNLFELVTNEQRIRQ